MTQPAALPAPTLHPGPRNPGGWRQRAALLTLLSLGACGGGGGAAGDSGPGVTATATRCFNADLFKIGTVAQLNYSYVSTAAGQAGTSLLSTLSTAMGTVGFLGYGSALRISNTVIASGALNYTTVSDSYYGTDLSQSLTQFGSVSSGANGTQLQDLATPPVPDRMFWLAQGETQTLTQVTTTKVLSSSGAELSSVVKPAERNSTQFLGFEDLTVTAGSFKGACKFLLSPNETQWYSATGSGVLLKSQTPEATLTLNAGTLNGVAVK